MSENDAGLTPGVELQENTRRMVDLLSQLLLGPDAGALPESVSDRLWEVFRLAMRTDAILTAPALALLCGYPWMEGEVGWVFRDCTRYGSDPGETP